MSFLAPFLLAGIAAIGLPILLHLRKQKPKENLAFSSLMFLEESTPVTKSKTSLQDIILLILRCLAIAVLAFAFARPFLPKEENSPFSKKSELHYILIDTSASMRGDSLEEALKAAKNLIKERSNQDRIALATFSDSLRPLITPETARRNSVDQQKANALALLGSIEADWNSTNLDLALISANSETAEDPAVFIHLISDLQNSAKTDRLEEEFWSNNIQIIPHQIELKENWTNAGVYIVPSSEDLPEARITNSEKSSNSEFTLIWEGQQPQEVYVAPGESALFEAPEGIQDQGTVKLAGDDFEYDNKSTWVKSVPPTASIFYPESADTSDSSQAPYYVDRALQATSKFTIEFDTETPEKTPPLTLTSGETDLKSILDNGGVVFYSLANNTSLQALAKLLKVKNASTPEADVEDYVVLGEIDYNSTLFQPFSDARYADFSLMRIWKYRVLPQEIASLGTVIASYDNGDPAFIEFNLGTGKLFLLTTTWRPDDSQIALTTKFPPLLHTLLELGMSKNENSPSYSLVNDTHDTPGIHMEEERSLSVQLDPRETLLPPLSNEELTRLGLPIEAPNKTNKSIKTQNHLSEEELAERQQIGWWLLLAAAAFILMETIVSAFPKLATQS